MRHGERLAVSLLLAGLGGAPAAAGDATHLESPLVVQAASTPECSGGVVYDDGGFEDAFLLAGDDQPATMAMRFDLPVAALRVEQVCACFTRTAAGADRMDFEVALFDANGPGGGPGRFLGAVPATAADLPVFPESSFYAVNTAALGPVLPSTRTYVGVRWPDSNIYLCSDRSPTTAPRSPWVSRNGGRTWLPLSFLSPPLPSRALGIRVDPLLAQCAAGDPHCLRGDRFRFEATFRTASGLIGAAQAVRLTDETAYLWFFSPSNVEVLVKVLDGCALNDRYWVFVAGLTDVHVELTVIDTQRGGIRTFTNPQGAAFLPVLDTSALSTCP